jgi:hypothetical protein
MRPSRWLILAAVAAATTLGATPASAQTVTRTWVSSTGDDANPCSRVAPCRTFTGAMAKTAPYGEVNCLDSGDFGPGFRVLESITISCEGVFAGVDMSADNGGGGAVVSAGPTDVVVLRGLSFNALQSAQPAPIGILIYQAGSVVIDHCFINNVHKFVSPPLVGSGIELYTDSDTRLTVIDTVIDNVSGSAIQIQPLAGNAQILVDNVRAAGSFYGLRVQNIGAGALGAISGVVRHSSFRDSVGWGILVDNSGASPNMSLMVDRDTIIGDGVGLQTLGVNAGMIVGGSTVTANGTGVQGLLFSYGDNRVNGNPAGDGTFTATIPTK